MAFTSNDSPKSNLLATKSLLSCLGAFLHLIWLPWTLNPHSRISWDLERTEGTSTFVSFMQWYLQGVHNTKRWGWTKPTKTKDFIKINQDDIISLSITSLFCPFHLFPLPKKQGGTGTTATAKMGLFFSKIPGPFDCQLRFGWCFQRRHRSLGHVLSAYRVRGSLRW